MLTEIEVTGATVALEDSGAGSPVLLLHGFPATRQLWSAVVPLLVDAGYRALVPDLVGYGTADAPDGLRIDMASQARWMFEALDTLEIDRVAIAAHDVGSAVAQLMVANAPRRVRGLVVLDGVYANEWAMDAIAGIRAWDPAAAARLYPVLARRLAKSPAMRAVPAAYEGERGGLRLIRAARDLDPGQTEHIAESLTAARVPALVIWGENDAYLPVATVARPLAGLLRAELVLVPGGHFTPIDCPSETGAAIRDFLRTLDARDEAVD